MGRIKRELSGTIRSQNGTQKVFVGSGKPLPKRRRESIPPSIEEEEDDDDREEQENTDTDAGDDSPDFSPQRTELSKIFATTTVKGSNLNSETRDEEVVRGGGEEDNAGDRQAVSTPSTMVAVAQFTAPQATAFPQAPPLPAPAPTPIGGPVSLPLRKDTAPYDGTAQIPSWLDTLAQDIKARAFKADGSRNDAIITKHFMSHNHDQFSHPNKWLKLQGCANNRPSEFFKYWMDTRLFSAAQWRALAADKHGGVKYPRRTPWMTIAR